MEGGMSFHGALVGIIMGTYIVKKKFTNFIFRHNCLHGSNRNFRQNSKFYKWRANRKSKFYTVERHISKN